MMDNHRDGMEFDALLQSDGMLRLPESVIRRLGSRGTRRYRVRIIEAKVAERLADKGISQDEIDRIASLQLEPRAQVEKFLLSEGVLRKQKAFRARIESYRKGRR